MDYILIRIYIYWYVFFYIYKHWYASFPPSLSLFISLFIQFPSFPCTWIISDFGRLSFQLTKLEQASWWVQRWVLHSKQSIFRSMASALMVTTARASCCWWFLDDCWLFECRRENVGFLGHRGLHFESPSDLVFLQRERPGRRLLAKVPESHIPKLQSLHRLLLGIHNM